MRTFLLALALVPALSTPAQQAVQPTAATPPPAGSNWQHVQALPAGQSLQVSARTSHANCKLRSVDADSLTCTRGKELVFQRADILTIRVPRRGRSSLIAAGVGAGVGVIVGVATGCSSTEQSQPWGCFLTPTRTQAAGILAVLFGGIGAGIGAATDLNRSTIYVAP
jgi:hypothetical protein